MLAAGLTLLAGCQKEARNTEAETVPGAHSVKLMFEDSDATKASLDGLTPKWSAGDQIWIGNGTDELTVTLEADDISDGVATIDVEMSGPLYAVYPAGVQFGLNTELDNIGIDIPAVTDGSFAKAHIAVAKGTSILRFKSAVSILEIPERTPEIDKIEIKAASIAGGFTLDDIGTSPHMHPVTSGGWITISDLKGKGPYYVAIGPGTLAAGAKFEYKQTDNVVNTRTTSADQTLEAGKIYNIGPAFKANAVPGLFSVSDSHKVIFAKGNLCCNSKTNTWSFDESQYPSYPTTATKLDEEHCYHFQWVTMAEYACGTAFPITGKLTDVIFTNDSNNGKSPNPDFTVGGEKGIWRCLTSDQEGGEWSYLLEGRSTAAGTASIVNYVPDARFLKCTVGDYYGLIVFPDQFVWPTGKGAPEESTATAVNLATYDFSIAYTREEFDKLESAGCVFIPAAGTRGGATISEIGIDIIYWSSSPHTSLGERAYTMMVWDTNLSPRYGYDRDHGCPIRLVRDF